MHNLEQIRAKNAHEAADATDKTSVAKLPSMIINNGLLATLAFSCEDGKDPRSGQKAAAKGLARHLKQVIPELGEVADGSALNQRLAAGGDLLLQRATTEALAYLSYLKRFAKKKEKES